MTETRHLPEPIVTAAVRAGVLREGPHASALFAHVDQDSRLTGFEIRRPDYRGFSTGGDKTLFRLPGRPGPGAAPVTRVVVTEAPIDAMSVAALEDLRAGSLYVAVRGGMGPEALRCLDLLLRDLAGLPSAALVIATDADRAGDAYAARLEAMGRVLKVTCERMRPPVEGDDWNGMLGKRREP